MENNNDYRIWHTILRKYFTAESIDFQSGIVFEKSRGAIHNVPLNRVLFEYKSPFKTKSGNSLYEGDVIKSGCDECSITQSVSREFRDPGVTWNISEDDALASELIGNIRENPELRRG